MELAVPRGETYSPCSIRGGRSNHAEAGPIAGQVVGTGVPDDRLPGSPTRKRIAAVWSACRTMVRVTVRSPCRLPSLDQHHSLGPSPGPALGARALTVGRTPMKPAATLAACGPGFQVSPSGGRPGASGALRTIVGIADAGIGPRHCGPHATGDRRPARLLPNTGPTTGQDRKSRRQAQDAGPGIQRQVPQRAKDRKDARGPHGPKKERTVCCASRRAWMSHDGSGFQATCHAESDTAVSDTAAPGPRNEHSARLKRKPEWPVDLEGPSLSMASGASRRHAVVWATQWHPEPRPGPHCRRLGRPLS